MEIFNKIKNTYEVLMKKVKFFIDKNNFTKTKLLLLVIFSGLLATVFEYTIFRKWYPEFISNNRIMLVTLIFIFIGMHFVFKISKMYEFIHKNRYKIACAFLLFVMIFKYSGSSIVNFNNFIEPDKDDRHYHTLLGKARMIRTDEWATSTTYILSQSQGENPFSYFNDKLRGTLTDMFTVGNSPVADILILGRPFQIGFLLFGNDVGLSFYWYARITAMLLGSYELCLILTKRNKKVSFVGMIMITFSAAVQWWYCMDTLLWGQIVIVLIDKFMNTDRKRNKYLCALGILIAGLSYIFVLYPAWQMSFGYVFLAIVVWLLIKNIKYGDYKFNKHDAIVIAVTIICLVLMLGRWYLKSGDTMNAMMSTDYPGDRVETGGGAYNLYAYFYNIFFTQEEFPTNPCEFSAMLSFYPIPIILGIIYVIRNKKDLHFWIPMLVVSLFLTIWCVWGFPAILANLTKMSMTTPSRVSIPLGTVCIYMLIYLFANFNEEKDKLINKKLTYFLSVVFTAYIIYRAKRTIGYEPYLDRFKILLGGEIFLAAIFGILNLNNDKIKNYCMYGLIAIALMSGLRVNPVIRTTDIFYTKPVAVKMQEIRNENPNAIWAVVDGGWYYNDYAVANGIRTINSTNIYPNLEMYETILGDKAEENRKTYNRYAHVNFDITTEESTVDLLYADNVAIKLNYKDLEKLNIEYILSTKDMSQEPYANCFEKVYGENKETSENNIFIYKVTKGN